MESHLMTHNIRLAESRVLITGGGSGLGRQMALQAAAAGAEVILWDLSAEGGKKATAEILAAGGRASFAQVDVTNRGVVERAAKKTGDIDVLINNAGVVSGASFSQLSAEAIERTYRVNVLSLYWMTQAFLPGMRERNHGCVVTIASAAGLIGVAKQTDYSASKFAAMGFTESLRAELRSEKSAVGTLTVCPFYIDTGMFEGVQTKFPALLPILHEADVAKKILRALEKGKAQLIMPRFAAMTPWMRILPVRAFDKLADFLGVNKTMEHFRGRS